MAWLLTFITNLGSTKAGQAFLTWLAQHIWNYVSGEMKKKLAKAEWEQNVKEVLDKYEQVIHEAQEKAKDGLTQEEKDEIRKKKIELETQLLNSGPT